MSRASHLVRTARQEAGLTQAELARRAGMTQSMIARMERPGANPTVDTLDAVLGAAGAHLTIAPHSEAGVDETLLAQNLLRTPAERLATHRLAARRAHAFREAGARGRA